MCVIIQVIPAKERPSCDHAKTANSCLFSPNLLCIVHVTTFAVDAHIERESERERERERERDAQLIPRRIIDIVATICQILRL